MTERHPESASEMISCPFCGEQIAAAAVLCRFCRSALVDPQGRRLTQDDARRLIQSPRQTAETSVSLGSALAANLFCPGLGSWKLGSRLRGAVVGVVTLLCITFAVSAYANAFQSEFGKAMRTGRTKALEAKLNEAQDNLWAQAAFWLYVYSFVDVGLIWAGSQKRSE
ncbi:MAG TPA: hypothetical protein PKO06_17635 [Candidatus Ozemobacteraceae bacterium]|nr:hypothetical protein [Candidatus Ozemobacteraceae bacterium]